MLRETDLPLPATWEVANDAWYPAQTFEDVSVAWLHLVAAGKTDAFRSLGTRTADRLLTDYPELVQRGDLRETVIRFLAIRACLFDFPAVEILAMSDFSLALKLQFDLQPQGEGAAAEHTAGFVDRLLRLSGAERVEVTFAKRSWDGDPQTRLEARWSAPLH